MGTFIYGPNTLEVEFDDRLLAHLRAVIVSKLRRSECFLFTWTEEVDETSNRQRSLWLHPAVAMSFTIESAHALPLNKAWVAALAVAANSNSGLTPRPEPTDG